MKEGRRLSAAYWSIMSGNAENVMEAKKKLEENFFRLVMARGVRLMMA
jgi:hypothetical protein